MRTMHWPRHGDDVILFVCIAAGSVLGFTATGGAAIGTALGAAAGMAVVAAHRHSRTNRGGRRWT